MYESHFQSFDETTDRTQGAVRIAALREQLARQDLDGFVVPRADRHQGEYVPPCEERLAWLTGFSGSAGLAVVLAKEAAIFVDGRYTIAVRDQVDTAVIAPVAIAEEKPDAWLGKHLGPGAKLGYDPWLATPAQVRGWAKAAQEAGATLVAVGTNPIDAIWQDRPPPPRGAISLRKPKLAGEAAAKKIARVSLAMGKADALLVSDPHAVAWLFNIRGADVGHTPLPLGFALVPEIGHPTLFVDEGKLSDRDAAALAKLATGGDHGVGRDRARGARQDQQDRAVRCRHRAGAAGAGPGGGRRHGDRRRRSDRADEARKNAAELAGTREAHRRDGAAVTTFLHWFATHARPGKLDEIGAAQALEHFRRESGLLKDLSFPTISAAGPNSAIPHYRVSKASNRKLDRGIYLVDSGAQYEDGTTDITRTLAVGRPTAEMRDRFTRVLKGMIAISRAIFPKGTSGAQLDALARQFLWAAGLDFDHGTGHGVGVYLSVHEGRSGSPRPATWRWSRA